MSEEVDQAHFNGLSPSTAELLAWLLEEMGEATQAIGKTLRHGLASHNPLVPGAETNRRALERELGDVLAALDMLIGAGTLDLNVIVRRSLEKTVGVKRWMHHQ